MIMSASEAPIEGSRAVGRNIAIGITIAVVAAVAIVVVILLVTMGSLAPSGGGT